MGKLGRWFTTANLKETTDLIFKLASLVVLLAAANFFFIRPHLSTVEVTTEAIDIAKVSAAYPADLPLPIPVSSTILDLQDDLDHVAESFESVPLRLRDLAGRIPVETDECAPDTDSVACVLRSILREQETERATSFSMLCTRHQEELRTLGFIGPCDWVSLPRYVQRLLENNVVRASNPTIEPVSGPLSDRLAELLRQVALKDDDLRKAYDALTDARFPVYSLIVTNTGRGSASKVTISPTSPGMEGLTRGRFPSEESTLSLAAGESKVRHFRDAIDVTPGAPDRTITEKSFEVSASESPNPFIQKYTYIVIATFAVVVIAVVITDIWRTPASPVT